jgi:hypothetical protein
MKKTFYSLLAFGFLLAGISKSSAQTCTIDQSYLGSNTLQTAIGSNTTVPDGQSFRAGLSGVLNAVSLDISASNPGCLLSTMNVKVDILNGDGINGAVLASQVFNIPTTLTRTLYTFNFSSPAVVSSSQLYTIIITLLPGQNCGSGEPQLIWYFNFPTSFWSATGGRQYQDGIVTSLGNTQYFNTCVGPDLAAALNFDGGDDKVNLGNGITASLTGGTKVTVEAWVKPTDLSNSGCIVGNYNTGVGEMQFLLRRAYNSEYQFWISNASNNWLNTPSVATPTLNVWQHVAGTWDGTVACIYVNGVLSGTTTPGITALGSASGNSVWLGANTINENHTGSIDEVRIWNIARTQCEINTYKNCEIPTTATGLLANYHFNQGINVGNNASITTLIDASSSAYTGTITGMPLTGATSNWVAPGGVTSGSVTPANLAITVGSTVTNSVICSGNSTTLSGTGANTYVWTGGVTNTVAFTPTVTNTYTVTGTNTLTGCTNTAVSSVTVNALPVVSVNSATICNGQNTTLTSTGGGTYLWSTGAVTSTITASPSSNAVYTSTVTSAAGCTATATGSVTVNSLPTISVNSGSICAGQSFTMIPSGADTYTYSNGSSVATPSANTTYSVSGTNTLTGCVSNVDAESNVTVNALPVVSVSSGSICAGQSYTIIANGASTYTSVPSIAGPVVTPTATTDYSITGTDANGCVTANAVVSSVTVNALPTISVNSGAICAGQSFTMAPSGAVTYTYSNGSSIATPTANSTYSVSGTDANGCVSNVDAVSSVTVNSLPTVSAVTNNTLLCTGETATLTASGTATTYTWSTTDNTTTVAVSPTVQTTYTVNGTDANGCVNSTTVTQDVSLCTGIVTLSNSNASVNVYPNPNNGLFVLELTTTSKVIVTNALGQVVIAETFEAGKHNLDIQNEATGVYFVKVIENNNQQIIKVVKQ